jgi:hypothetical protein
MSSKEKDREKQISTVITDLLSKERKLSKKVLARIEKSAAKLSERLQAIFDKEDKKADSKASAD